MDDGGYERRSRWTHRVGQNHQVTTGSGPRPIAGQQKPVVRVFGKNRSAEGLKSLAVLDSLIEPGTDVCPARIRKQRAAPQCPGPELVASLKPTHDLAVREQCRRGYRWISDDLRRSSRANDRGVDRGMIIREAEERGLFAMNYTYSVMASLAVSVRNGKGRTDRRAGIMRCSRDKKSIKWPITLETKVGHTVEGNST